MFKKSNFVLLIFIVQTLISFGQAPYDYSTNTGWTQNGVGTSITGGVVKYENCTGQVRRRIYSQHQVYLNNSWRLDFDFKYSAVGSGGPGHILACLTAGTLDPNTTSGSNPWATISNQDAIFATFQSTNHSNNASTFRLQGYSKNDANALTTPNPGILLAANTQYFITLERLDRTHGRISAFTNVNRLLANLVGSECFVIDAGVSNILPILQHGVVTWADADRNMTGIVDNTSLTPISVSPGLISPNQVICYNEVPLQLSVNSPQNITLPLYQWESSINCSGFWTAIPSATSATYSPPALTVKTCYRRITTSSLCSGPVIISNTCTITVRPSFGLGNYSQTICSGGSFVSKCAPVAPEGSTYTYTWGLVGSQLSSHSQCFTPGGGNYYLNVTDQNGCSSTVYFTATVDQTCVVACSEYRSPILNTTIESSFYGPATVSTICQPVIINESCSQNENSVYVGISTFDLVTWTPGTTLYAGWLPSVPTDGIINLNQLVGNTFVPGQLYILGFNVGPGNPGWITAAPKFFRVANCAKNANQIGFEEIDMNSLSQAIGSDVSISPNPTNGIFNIDLSEVSAEKVLVYNMLGKVVSEQIVTDNSRNIEVDLTELPTSIYMVHVHTAGGEVILKKVTKN